MAILNVLLALIMSIGVANYGFEGEPTVTVVDVPTEIATEPKSETTTTVETPNINYEEQATDETIYEELDTETNYIEIDIEEGLTYSIYKYDNLEDYNNHSNKKLVKTVNKDEYELISIEMHDIVKNDYPAEYLSDQIITENFLENKYMSLNLNDTFNFVNDGGYEYYTNDDGVKVGVSGFEPMNFMEAELETLTVEDKNKLYFQVGFPVSGTEFQLIPLYSIVADNRNIKTRIVMANAERDYKFFASVDVQTDEPTTLIVVDRTAELMNLK